MQAALVAAIADVDLQGREPFAAQRREIGLICVGHIGPEAAVGGPIGLLRDGDIIEIDGDKGRSTSN